MRTRQQSADLTRPLSHYPYDNPKSSNDRQKIIKIEPTMDQCYSYRDPGFSMEPYGTPSPYGQTSGPVAPPPKTPAHYDYEQRQSWSSDEPEDDNDVEYKPQMDQQKSSRNRAPPTQSQMAPARKYTRKGEQEKNSLEYRLKRDRNNTAVRLSRKRAADAKNAEKQKTQELVEENAELRGYRDILVKLKREIRVYNGNNLFLALPTLREIHEMSL